MGTEVSMMINVQEKVKAKIQESFVDLIPPEHWNKLVNAELENFTKVEFPKLVKQEAENRLRDLLKEEFKKPEWAEKWGYDGATIPSELLSKVLKELAPDLVTALFTGVAQNVVQFLRDNQNNRLY